MMFHGSKSIKNRGMLSLAYGREIYFWSTLSILISKSELGQDEVLFFMGKQVSCVWK